MVKMKAIDIIKILCTCEATGTLIKIRNGTTTFENILDFTCKVKYTLTIKSNNSTLKYSLQRNKNISWHKDLCTSVYNIIIHNYLYTQKLAWISKILCWGKETRPKKKRKKKKRVMLFDSIHIKFWKRKNESIVMESRALVTWDHRLGDWWQRVMRQLLMMMEIYYLLYSQYNIDCSGDYMVYTLDKTNK